MGTLAGQCRQSLAWVREPGTAISGLSNVSTLDATTSAVTLVQQLGALYVGVSIDGLIAISPSYLPSPCSTDHLTRYLRKPAPRHATLGLGNVGGVNPGFS